MKLFNKKVLLFLSPVILLFSAILAYNLMFDPFGVIHGDMLNHYGEPNQRFLKAKHILNNPNKYNAYIFGSSRAGKIDPRNINTDDRWYNFSYAEGLPAEHLEDLRLLVEHDVAISKVVIGIGDISYLVDPFRHKTQSLRKPYKNWHTPYLEFLFLKPDMELRQTQKKIKVQKNQVFYDIYESGMPDTYFRDKWVNQAKEKHCKNEKFNTPTWAFYYKPRIAGVIKEIRDIVALCQSENIELIFYVNPMHATTYLNQDMEQFTAFLIELSELSSFYDFSGINEITTDNYYYYETSHFRPLIGDLMMESMFNNQLNEFGQFVNDENIQAVVADKLKEAQAYKEARSKQ